jgi:hypothetical protein
MARFRVDGLPMPSGDDAEDPNAPEMEEFRAVVPKRAVLTELARGFLLAQESQPDRAVRFAATFLKERSQLTGESRTEGTRPVTPGRLRLGRGPRGAVDPSNFPVER